MTNTTQEELLPWTDLLAYVLQDDLHNRLTPRVIDIAYTAFMLAKQPNKEDGGDSDWFNDTKPAIKEAIDKLRADLFADREQRRTPPAEQPAAEGMRDAEIRTAADTYGTRHYQPGMSWTGYAFTFDQLNAFVEAHLASKQKAMAWLHVQGDYTEASIRRLDPDEIARGWKEYPLYAHPPANQGAEK